MTTGSVAVPVGGAGHGARTILVAGASLLLLILVVVAGMMSWPSSSGTFAPSSVAIADIPGNYLVLYQQLLLRYGVDWAVLAAIGKVECDHGRLEAAGCNPPGSVNAAGATGPMQFIGSTWRSGTPPMTVPDVAPPTRSTASGYATDGDGDGVADVWDAADAIAGAARLLKANGAPGDYRQAVFAYNHASSYVDAVLAQAAAYRSIFGTDPSGGTSAALSWATAHVGRFTYHLGTPTDPRRERERHAESRAVR